MADGRKEGTAFLLAGPAGGPEVNAPWVGMSILLFQPSSRKPLEPLTVGLGYSACVGGLALLPAS